jgi:hypothetical protein
MRKVVLVVLVLLVVAGGWLLWGGGAPSAVEGRESSVGRGAAVAAVQGRAGAQDGEAGAPERRARKDRSERDALRRRIVEALERRGRDEPRAGEGGEGEGAAAAGKKKAGGGVEEEAATPGGIVDRSGNRGYLMKVMNEDLMPLVDECYGLARQAKPALAGELRLDVTLLGDAELGGVVDSVEPGKDNGLADPGLVECVQQSILALTLPPPPEGGRDEFSLSLKLTPEDGGATAG